nr:hypothetical protein CTI12_AA445420 [Tanacetum cinerariifolium]
MSWSCLSFCNILLLLLFNLTLTRSNVTTLPIHCEYPCQPAPTRPLYGYPPPPSPKSPPVEPVYESPPPPKKPPTPPPSEPVYEAPPQPKDPSCVPPPAPPLPTGPLYGGPPAPQLPGNCQPSMQNCVYPTPNPNQNIYQPYDSAYHLQLNCLQILALMFLVVLHF